MLRRIHSNADNLVHGRLPCLRFATTSFWHTRCRRGPSTPSSQDDVVKMARALMDIKEPLVPIREFPVGQWSTGIQNSFRVEMFIVLSGFRHRSARPRA